MWTYVQRSGHLLHNGELVGSGYSGFEQGKNDPAWQDVIGVGPIPSGYYTIGRPTCVEVPGPHGPFVLPLTPDPKNEMHGRAGFLIHGDAILHAGSASHGCIILQRTIRNTIAGSGDASLAVVPDLSDIV